MAPQKHGAGPLTLSWSTALIPGPTLLTIATVAVVISTLQLLASLRGDTPGSLYSFASSAKRVSPRLNDS